jgi:hypothetical protein
MFGDWSWLSGRTSEQQKRFNSFLEKHSDKRIAVIETGAGKAIPTIRNSSESIGRKYSKASVIRINPRESEIAAPHISIPAGALKALKQIDLLL